MYPRCRDGLRTLFVKTDDAVKSTRQVRLAPPEVSNGRLRSSYQPTGGARLHRPARSERGARARAIRRRLVAVRVQPPTLAYLRADRRAAGAAQEARRRARGCRRSLGRAGVRDVPARTEIPVPRAPVRVRQGA